MNLGTIFQSVESWRKLSTINMKPKVAFAVLKYSKKVGAEFELIEEKRRELVYEITGAEVGTEVKIEPGSRELVEYMGKFSELLVVESDLEQVDLKLSDVIEAVDEKDEALTVRDLAVLEPFFADHEELEKA